MDFDFTFHRSDQLLVVGLNGRNNSRYGAPAFRNKDSLRFEFIQNFQALRFELRSRHGLLNAHTRSLAGDQ